MRRQALSLLVENNPGVTSRISGLFSRRGYNIDSFSSGVTADPKYTRITIVASGDELILDQIEKQLLKLEDVLDIKKLEPGLSVTRDVYKRQVSHRGGGKNSYSPFKDVRWTDGCAQRVCQ